MPPELSPLAALAAARPAGAVQKSQAADPSGAGSFAASLAEAAGGTPLKFSAHAAGRLASRNINLSREDLARVEQAANLAARRGSRDTLLMMDTLGLVVNIQNRTVLTALDLSNMNDGVVTNIDSTVLVRK